MTGDLEAWLDAQESRSRRALAASVSPTGFRHERREFGQNITAAPGSVLASRHRARWDPAPDYAYHWVRDAGVVMRLAPLLARQDSERWRRKMTEYIRFSLRIATRPGPPRNPLRATTRPEFRKFLRPDAELAGLTADRLLGEPRANIDGSVDAERWSRPQHDGPALRALSCLTWEDESPELRELLSLDLGYTLRHAGEACVGPWEEEGEYDRHGFTLLAQRAAIRAGIRRGRLTSSDDATIRALGQIEHALSRLWSEDAACIRARAAGPQESDAAIILGVLLDDDAEAMFGPTDRHVLATATWLRDWSSGAFPVNAGSAAQAIGRNPSDRFFGGNPWLPTTLAFAEFYFRLARDVLSDLPADAVASVAQFLDCVTVPGLAPAPPQGRAPLATRLVAEGEGFLATVRRLAPADGRLPEQVDKLTGQPTSCPDLTWSHAALVAALEERRRARSRRSAGG